MTRTGHDKTDAKAVAAAITTLVVWSSAFSGVSIAVGPGGGYGPGQMALLRFIVASLTMGVVAIFTGLRLPKREDLPVIAASALFGITIYHLCFTWGETVVSPGAAALVIASGPIWTALLAIAFLGERLNRWGWTGVALAFAGVAAIAFAGEGGVRFEPMVLLELGAAISTACYFVIGKKPLRTYSSLEFTTYIIWIGTLPMLVFLPGLVRQLPAAPLSSTLIVVFLGVFPGAVAYFLWSYALARMPASTTASFLYAQPVLATVVAFVVQGILPSAIALVGGALALAGVILVQTKGRPRHVVSVSVATSPSQRDDVRALALESMHSISERLKMPLSHFDEELAMFDEWYGGERGRAFVATLDGRPVAGVVFREWNEGDAEMRRMYVKPDFRRKGLARALVRAVVEEASALGYRRVILLTSADFDGAANLYASEGFVAIEPYREAFTMIPVALAREL